MKKALIWIVPAALILIVVAVTFANRNSAGGEVITGIVEGVEIDAASKIPGRIEKLLVEEGSIVKAGDTLAIMESKEIDAKVKQAEGAVNAAREKFRMAKNGARKQEIEGARNLYEQARSQYEYAEKTWNRFEKLYQDSVISLQRLDEIEFKYNAAKAQMEAARSKLNMAEEGARSEEIAAAGSLVERAEGALDEANAYRSELAMLSPVDGEVSTIAADQGEIVASGYPVVSILEEKSEYVILQLREDYLNGIKKGTELNGAIKALGIENASFEVTHIASMADFATWRPTNQKGDFDLKTFEIRLKPEGDIEGLRPGMTINFRMEK